jgi:hypothetical protein
MDPASVNDASPKATLGGLYVFESNYASNTTPTGLYRYVQIKDIAVADGDVLCPDAATGVVCTKASKDRSADIISTLSVGIAVGTITADYYGYVLVRGRHSNILTDGGVAAGDALYPHATTDGAADTRAETVASGTFGTALAADSSAGRVDADVNCL